METDNLMASRHLNPMNVDIKYKRKCAKQSSCISVNSELNKHNLPKCLCCRAGVNVTTLSLVPVIVTTSVWKASNDVLVIMISSSTYPETQTIRHSTNIHTLITLI